MWDLYRCKGKKMFNISVVLFYKLKLTLLDEIVLWDMMVLPLMVQVCYFLMISRHSVMKEVHLLSTQ